MNSNRILELLFVVALISVGYKAMTPEQTEAPGPTPQTAQQTPESRSGSVEFSLPRVDGEDYHFQADGQSWTLITLTATGCQGCIERQETDSKAYELVKGRGGRAISMYLYGNQARFENLLKEHPNVADAVLADYQGKVGVGQLKGSDSQCWLLLKPDGTLAWQGGANLETLKAQLI